MTRLVCTQTLVLESVAESEVEDRRKVPGMRSSGVVESVRLRRLRCDRLVCKPV